MRAVLIKWDPTALKRGAIVYWKRLGMNQGYMISFYIPQSAVFA
jgi:hypothetical protein